MNNLSGYLFYRIKINSWINDVTKARKVRLINVYLPLKAAGGKQMKRPV